MKEERFEFGSNWKSFLESLDEERIDHAIESLRNRLDVNTLQGKSFLDLGCGSGLFSLAAHRMGANVISLDFDPQCIACTRLLHQRYAESENASADQSFSNWTIQQGSVLEAAKMQTLGEHDVVYSWGVLHHTGDMVAAIEQACLCVRPRGKFVIAIYNDQGGASRRWLKIKQMYNRLPGVLRPAWVVLIASLYESKFALARLAGGRNPLPFADWRAKKTDRGMSVWHDWVDWIGGLPFEVATPEAIIMPLRERGFVLDQLHTVGSGWGCNEYVFTRFSADELSSHP